MAKPLWTRISGDLIQARIPLPFPLRWVNSYLVKGAAGYTLIDPGLHTGQALEAWRQIMAEVGCSFAEISAIVLTHHHPDHYGLAGWFQEQTGAPVFMSETGMRQADLLWGEERPLTDAIERLFLAHGMNAQLAEPLREHLESFVPLVSPRPQATCIGKGETIRIGNRNCLIMEHGGHAAGHLSFLDTATKEIFCGDQVLPQITPNISYIPGIDPDPLRTYLAGLRELSRLKAAVAYPGHREPFAGIAHRAEEIIQHHEQRLLNISGFMKNGATAYEICLAMFGANLSLHQLRFALSETIAHMIYLARGGDETTTR
ncbi:MAG TPA: MBL fold metallo-hydrolase [Bacilli bacterium]